LPLQIRAQQYLPVLLSRVKRIHIRSSLRVVGLIVLLWRVQNVYGVCSSVGSVATPGCQLSQFARWQNCSSNCPAPSLDYSLPYAQSQVIPTCAVSHCCVSSLSISLSSTAAKCSFRFLKINIDNNNISSVYLSGAQPKLNIRRDEEIRLSFRAHYNIT